MRYCSKSKNAIIQLNFAGCIFFAALSVAMLLTACVTEEVKPEKENKSRSSSMTVVSSFRSKVRMQPGASFSWIPNEEKMGQDDRLTNVPLKSMLENAIINTLQNMGYVYSKTAEQSDFLVSYQMAMGDKQQQNVIGQQYGVQPGLAGASTNINAYDKGTLVVDIIQSGSHVSIWNGAIQAFVTFDLPDDVRKQRVDTAVFLLMRGFQSGK